MVHVTVKGNGAPQNSEFELSHSQHNIRRDRPDQEHRQHRRPVLVVVQPLRPAIAQVPRAEDKDDRRVRDGDERDPGEEPRADQPDRVLGRDEVEQRRRDRADVDGEVEPFLRCGAREEQRCAVMSVSPVRQRGMVVMCVMRAVSTHHYLPSREEQVKLTKKVRSVAK